MCIFKDMFMIIRKNETFHTKWKVDLSRTTKCLKSTCFFQKCNSLPRYIITDLYKVARRQHQPLRMENDMRLIRWEMFWVLGVADRYWSAVRFASSRGRCVPGSLGRDRSHHRWGSVHVLRWSMGHSFVVQRILGSSRWTCWSPVRFLALLDLLLLLEGTSQCPALL